MIILDTNVISETVKPYADPAVQAWSERQDSKALHLTATVTAELLGGVVQLPVGRRREELAAAVEAVVAEFIDGRVLRFDLESSRAYAEVRSLRRSAGRPISFGDAQIAAVCLVHDATLATRNVPDFAGCGIRLVNPWEG